MVACACSIMPGVVVVAEESAGPEERDIDRLRVVSRGPPAEEPYWLRTVVVGERTEVVDPLVRLERGPDAGLGQLARESFRHLLVAHVAPLRAVEGDFESV